MKDFGNDLKNGVWLFIGVAIVSPLVFITPIFLLFIISLTFAYFGLSKLFSYRGLKTWIKTSGTLLKSDIGLYNLSVGLYAPPIPHYFPLTQYAYTYNDKKYENNVYAYDRKSIWTESKIDAETAINKLKKETEIFIFVNPKNPCESAIDITISKKRLSHSYALLVTSLLILILGVFLYVTIDS